MKDPKVKMWLSLVMTCVPIGLVLFLGAGTIHYWQAWVFLGVVVVSSALLTSSIIEDPILLENRTKFGPTVEKRIIQNIIVLCSGIPAIATFIVPVLDRRFGWSKLPSWLSVVGDLLIL